jgi:hypothetical protein
MNRIWRFHGGINITASCDLRKCCDFRGICCSIIRVLQTVKTEGAVSSEVSVPIYQTRRRQRFLPNCLYLSTRLLCFVSQKAEPFTIITFGLYENKNFFNPWSNMNFFRNILHHGNSSVVTILQVCHFFLCLSPSTFVPRNVTDSVSISTRDRHSREVWKNY